MTARIGKRIREVLAISEKLGQPASYSEIHAHMEGDHSYRNTAKYCTRAAERGLMTKTGDWPAKYQAAEGWREVVGEYVKPQPRPKPAFVHRLPKKIINSVFAMGAA